jgi:hypothetical protein
MTTGPRPTPHPIILHIDDNGNPVRLAEASAIYVASAVIGTLSAINYQGLGINGGADGNEGSVQFKSNNGFAGEEGFIYNDDTFTLNVINVNITNTLSSVNLRSSVVSSTNSSAVNLYATTISATTVCATNYNAALEALSFQNLDNRYLNASGDSVTGSFYLQNVSAVNLSATNYLNIPSTSAIWNASAIQGIPVTSTPPSLGESLVFKDGYWQPSAVGGGVGGTPGDPALSIQFKNGSFFSGVESIKYNSSINGIQSVGLSSTNLSSTNLSSTTLRSVVVCATTISATTYQNLQEDTAKWNASKIYGTPFDKGDLLLDDFITYNGVTAWKNTTKADVANLLYPLIQPQIPSGLATWNASAIRGVTVTSTAPTINNVLIYNGSVWTPSSSISLANITAVNLGGTDIVGSRANITNVCATTVSATTYRNLPTSSLSGLADVSANTVSGGQALVYSSSVSKWVPGYRIFQSSSTPTNTIGSNGDIYFEYVDTTGSFLSSLSDIQYTVLSDNDVLTWDGDINKWVAAPPVNPATVGNASSILGRQVIAAATAVPTPNLASSLGPLVYIYPQNTYQAVGFNNEVLNGTRNIDSTGPLFPQGLITASYLGSAIDYFQINPYWKSPQLTSLAAFIDYPGYPDIPTEKDVLVFTEDLYSKSLVPGVGALLQTRAWTWKGLTFSGGYIQDVDTDGGVTNNILTYNGSKWIPSTSAIVTSVSATSAIFEVVTSASINNLKTTRHAMSRAFVPIVANSVTLNLNNAQVFEMILSANVNSLSITNEYPGGVAHEFTLVVKYNAQSPGKSITWTENDGFIEWPSSSPPALSLTDGQCDIFKFITLDNGNNWFAYVVGQNYTLN